MIYNFSPGPAMLPREVMLQAQSEFLDWHGSGASIMEVSHRGQHFIDVAHQSEHCLRELLDIPDNYHVLFLQGGAQLQNAAIPMNIKGDAETANYMVTGVWSRFAEAEARQYLTTIESCHMSDSNFTTVAPVSDWQIDNDGAYFFYCDNETVHGVEFPFVPDVAMPLVCDMSSNLLTRPIDVSKFGLIFACAQKNFGPAGITVVIVRDELLARQPSPYLPSVINYRIQHESESMKNTPSTYSWYMAGLVFEWTRQQGGVAEMDRRARERSSLVYDFIDNSEFYHCPVDPKYRSRMNVVFDLADEKYNEAFLEAALQEGLIYLKGHRSRGGMRASMYNAMPLEGAHELVRFMRDFSAAHS